jgi:hypothetical protein
MKLSIYSGKFHKCRLVAFYDIYSILGSMFRILVCFTLFMTSIQAPAFAQELVLPASGQRLYLSPKYAPAILKGLKINPQKPLTLEFVLDPGQSNQADLTNQSNQLIRYFLAGVTTPEKDLWVNLSPYEKDRIVPDAFGQTDMGRDLLVQDYLLKQITSSLIYPEDNLGKIFWTKVYQAAAKEGSINIPVNTFNKVWIMPQKAVVYENSKNMTAYVTESHLKVMLEEDYLAKDKSTQSKPTNNYSAIIKDIVIPVLEQEINEGERFAQLRQIYNSLILATWYKKKLKTSILGQAYVEKNKTAGINIEDTNAKEEIYQQYLKAFKQGVFNFVKEDKDAAGKLVPRKYFSGGMGFAGHIDKAMSTTLTPPSLIDNALKVTANLKPERLSIDRKIDGMTQERIQKIMARMSEMILLPGERSFEDLSKWSELGYGKFSTGILIAHHEVRKFLPAVSNWRNISASRVSYIYEVNGNMILKLRSAPDPETWENHTDLIAVSGEILEGIGGPVIIKGPQIIQVEGKSFLATLEKKLPGKELSEIFKEGSWDHEIGNKIVELFNEMVRKGVLGSDLDTTNFLIDTKASYVDVEFLRVLPPSKVLKELLEHLRHKNDKLKHKWPDEARYFVADELEKKFQDQAMTVSRRAFIGMSAVVAGSIAGYAYWGTKENLPSKQVYLLTFNHSAPSVWEEARSLFRGGPALVARIRSQTPFENQIVQFLQKNQATIYRGHQVIQKASAILKANPKMAVAIEAWDDKTGSMEKAGVINLDMKEVADFRKVIEMTVRSPLLYKNLSIYARQQIIEDLFLAAVGEINYLTYKDPNIARRNIYSVDSPVHYTEQIERLYPENNKYAVKINQIPAAEKEKIKLNELISKINGRKSVSQDEVERVVFLFSQINPQYGQDVRQFIKIIQRFMNLSGTRNAVMAKKLKSIPEDVLFLGGTDHRNVAKILRHDPQVRLSLEEFGQPVKTFDHGMSVKDKAMTSTGGIDLKSMVDELEINGNFEFNPHVTNQIKNAAGFKPVIIRISSLPDVAAFIGAN